MDDRIQMEEYFSETAEKPLYRLFDINGCKLRSVETNELFDDVVNDIDHMDRQYITTDIKILSANED